MAASAAARQSAVERWCIPQLAAESAARSRNLGEVVSKTLECEPRRWKIVEHVGEQVWRLRRHHRAAGPLAPNRA